MDPHLHRPPADASPSDASKLQVVYYLSRSGHLEHPHLLEVAVLPSEGLRLRDVKKRLAMIRGKRLPCSFAWSYKRGYKNGYVWQDVCDDDLILPAQGSEYVLKGSEIVAESHAEKCPQYDTESSEPAGNKSTVKSKLTDKSSSKQCGMPHNKKKDDVTELSSAMQRGLSNQNPPDSQHSHLTFEVTGNTTTLANCSTKAAANGHLFEENLLLNAARTSSSSSDVGHHLHRHQTKLHSSSTSVATEAETVTTTSDEEVRSVWKPLPSTSSIVKPMNGKSSTILHVTMVECGTDAATQTDDEPTPILDCHDAKKTSSSVTEEEHQQNPTVLHKVEIISPPSSSSTTSTPSTNSRYMPTDESYQGATRAIHHQYPNSWAKQPSPSIIEEKDELLMISSSVDLTPPLSSTEGSTPRKAGGLSMCCHENHVLNQALDTEPSSARPTRARHLGAMSLLQFVSCGGLDVKEQILPMSTIYHVKSATSYASTPMSVHVPPSKLGSSGHVHQHNKVPSAEQLCEALGYNTAGQGKGSSGRTNMVQGLQSMSKGGGGGGAHAFVSINTNLSNVKLKSSTNVSQELNKGAAANCNSQSNNSCSSINHHNGDASKDVNCITPRSLAVPPDVISIGRSSISDRSTNVSRELDYQTDQGSYNNNQHQNHISKHLALHNHSKAALSRGSPKLTLMEHINGRDQATLDECKTHTSHHQLLAGSLSGNTNQATSRRAVSGEIFRGSPLFMPGSSTPNTRQQQLYQYHNHDHYQQQHHNHHQHYHNRAASLSFRLGTSVSSSPALISIAPINAPSSNDRVCHNNEIHGSPTTINNTCAAAAAVDNNSCKEGMPPTSCRLIAGGEVGVFERRTTWDERTLQNAVDLSLPPLELLVLHECPHCSRKLKPDLLKAHMKACSSSTPNFASSPMKPPKSGESHGNLYHRFLKASPSPQPPAATAATSPLR